jgi:hypothetical protein
MAAPPFKHQENLMINKLISLIALAIVAGALVGCNQDQTPEGGHSTGAMIPGQESGGGDGGAAVSPE